LRATTTSVRWPTTSRLSRIHDRRASSRRTPVASLIAPARLDARPDGSRTARLIPARRASAPSRPRRSTTFASSSIRCGRSMTRRSTVRPESSAPAIEIPSWTSAGVTTTSHSGLTPRARASTGSNAAARSSHATMDPAACASATSRRTMVVRPLDRSPRSETPMPRVRPPGPRIASRAGKPVEKTFAGSGRPLGQPSISAASSGSSSGTVARAPTTSPTRASPRPRSRRPTSRRPTSRRPTSPGPTSRRSPDRAGAAAPHLVRRVARAAVTSGESAVMDRVSNRCSNESRAPRVHGSTGPTGPPPVPRPCHLALTRLLVTASSQIDRPDATACAREPVMALPTRRPSARWQEPADEQSHQCWLANNGPRSGRSPREQPPHE
jgi:hypothetical protein